MRTEEGFASVWKELKWFVNFHNRGVWIIPKEDKYILSIVSPDPKDLPKDTVAIKYDTKLDPIQYIKGNN